MVAIPKLGSGRKTAVKPLKMGAIKSKKPSGISPDKIREGNAKNVAALEKLGIKYKNPDDEPKFLDKLFGTLSAPMVGVESLVHNAVSKSNDKINPLTEMVKSAKGERVINGSHILDEFGVKPKSAFGKFLKGAAGVAIDAGLDPLTYLSFGFGATTKIRAAENAAKLFDTGIDAARMAKLAEYEPKLAKLVDAGGDIAKDAIKALPHDDQLNIWKAILRETGHGLGDTGGIKAVLGIGDKAPKVGLVGEKSITGAVERLVPSAVKDSELVGKVKNIGATAADLFTPFYKDKAEQGILGAYRQKALRDVQKRGLKNAVSTAVREAKEVFDGVDEEARNLGTIAFQRLDKHAALKEQAFKKLDEMYALRDSLAKQLENASDPKKAAQIRQAILDNKRDLGAFRDKLTRFVESEKLNPAEFKKELAALGVKEDQLDKATEAFSKFSDAMKKEHLREIKFGSTEQGKIIGDRGAFYVAGIDGKPHKSVSAALQREAKLSLDDLIKRGAPEEEVAAAQSKLDNLLNIRTPDSEFAAAKGGTTNHAAGKVFNSLEERLNAGIGATTDAQEIMAKRLANGRRAAVNDTFFDSLAHDFGEAIPQKLPFGENDPQKVRLHWEKGIITDTSGQQYRLPKGVAETVDKLRGFMEDPRSVKTWNDGIGKLTQIWKSQAVATPGFAMRNAFSNYFLASAYGMGKVDVWTDAFKMSTGLLDDAATIGKGHKVGEVRQMLEEHAVIDGSLMSEVAESNKKLGTVGRIAAGGKPAEMMHGINSKVEESGRIAVFVQALDQGMTPREAALYTDRVLYSYDPSDLTDWEKGVKNVVPFYVWMRRNLPAQVGHLIHDPKVLTFWDKLKDNGDEVTGNTTNWGEMPAYMRDNHPIPIPLGGDRKMYLNPNFGWQDVRQVEDLFAAAKLDFDPLLRDTAGALSPYIKTPIELGTNTDLFKQDKLVKYQGELTAAPVWAQKLEDTLKGNPAWEAAKAQGSAKVAKDGTLMVSPVFLKLLSNIPMLANVTRATTPSDQQASRIMSMTLGIKPYADESAKWHDNRAYDDQTNLNDAMRALKNLGIDTKAAKESVSGKKKKSKPTKLETLGIKKRKTTVKALTMKKEKRG